MYSFPTGELFVAGLAPYALGSISGLLLKHNPGIARGAGCGFAVLGAVLQGSAGVAALLGGGVEWSTPAGVPRFAYSFSAYFTIALSLLAASVSIYSLGYLSSIAQGLEQGVKKGKSRGCSAALANKLSGTLRITVS